LTIVEPVEPVVSLAGATSAAVGGGTLAGSGIGTAASIASWLGWLCAHADGTARLKTRAVAVPVRKRSKRRPCMEQIPRFPVGRKQNAPQSHAAGEAAPITTRGVT
jgi:hypothetical protein